MDQFSLPLDRKPPSNISLRAHLAGQIRRKILSGELPGDALLPPSRELAAELGIARGTVVAVFEELAAEGFLTARQGSGTRVAGDSLYTGWQAANDEALQGAASTLPRLRYDRRGPAAIDFRPGIADLARFPRKEWLRACTRVLLDYAEESLSYGSRLGARAARGEIARYLHRAKGIRCTEHEVFLLAGSVDGFHLIREFASREGFGFATEDPAYHQIPLLFGSLDPFAALPVDERGVRTDSLPAGPHLVYLTPSHQFPLGGVLPIQRRIRLVENAAAEGSYLIEDDYDGEFRFSGAPVPSLAYLSPERVIHVGTFSKTLCGALRLGYMVVPPALVEQFVRLREESGQYPALIQQYALYELMRSGAFERHLSRMRKSYSEKMTHLRMEVDRSFGGGAELLGATTGMHAVLRLRSARLDGDFLERLAGRGVLAEGVWEYSLSGRGHTNELILGYGNLSPEEMTEGVRRLARAIGGG